MFVTAIEVQGFRDLPRFVATELGPVVTVHGPDPGATALADALELFFAAFRADDLQRLLRRWGAIGPAQEAELTGSPLPEQAVWADPLPAPWIATEARNLTITLDLALDPVQMSALRGLGAREPRLVSGLTGSPTARVTVGGLLATSHDALALTVQSVYLGGESFPCAPGQRQPWMTSLLCGLAGRFVRHDPADATAAGATALAAQTSWDRYASWLRWQGALPPELGHVRAARGPGDRPVLLADDLPIRRHGHRALERAALAADVYLSGADILWAECEDRWVEDSTEGDGSPLEQVWRVARDGELRVVPISPGDPELTAVPPLPLRPVEPPPEVL